MCKTICCTGISMFIMNIYIAHQHQPLSLNVSCFQASSNGNGECHSDTFSCALVVKSSRCRVTKAQKVTSQTPDPEADLVRAYCIKELEHALLICPSGNPFVSVHAVPQVQKCGRPKVCTQGTIEDLRCEEQRFFKEGQPGRLQESLTVSMFPNRVGDLWFLNNNYIYNESSILIGFHIWMVNKTSQCWLADVFWCQQDFSNLIGFYRSQPKATTIIYKTTACNQQQRW